MDLMRTDSTSLLVFLCIRPSAQGGMKNSGSQFREASSEGSYHSEDPSEAGVMNSSTMVLSKKVGFSKWNMLLVL
jgi:hypothetical protein